MAIPVPFFQLCQADSERVRHRAKIAMPNRECAGLKAHDEPHSICRKEAIGAGAIHEDEIINSFCTSELAAVLGLDLLQVTHFSTIQRRSHIVHFSEQLSNAAKSPRIVSLLGLHD